MPTLRTDDAKRFWDASHERLWRYAWAVVSRRIPIRVGHDELTGLVSEAYGGFFTRFTDGRFTYNGTGEQAIFAAACGLLATICRRRVADWARRRLRNSANTSSPVADEQSTVVANAESREPDPADEASNRELSGLDRRRLPLLESALACLQATDAAGAAVVRLHAIEGMSYRTIAARLSRPVTVIHRLQHSALRRLRAILEELERQTRGEEAPHAI